MLLRTIQQKKLRRVGGNKDIYIDVRILVASNERLSEAARSGKFREDLYHRFNEFSIDVPSLRNRKGDIMFFADKFLVQTADELHKSITGFSDEVKQIFQNYPWYGNLRELKNIIKRAALLADKGKIEITGLPFELVNYAKLAFEDSEGGGAEPVKAEHITTPEVQRPVSSSTESIVHENVVHADEHKTLNLKKAAQEAEYEAILDALKKAGFNKSKAAEILGIDRKTLYNKMKRINIER
jgi:two-component system response regulator HydG